MASKSVQYRVPVGVLIHQVANGVTTRSLTQSYAFPGSNTQTGSGNALYKDQILAGIDATTSYSRSGFDIKPGFFDMTSTQLWGGQNIVSRRFERLTSVFPNIPSLGNSVLTGEASSRLKRKLRQFTGQSNQLTNVAELRDVPKTIKSVAGSASKLISTVLQSNKRGRDLQKFAADQWLTWSFGVLPTLGAVDDAVSSLGKYLKRDDHRNVEYGVHSEDWVLSTTSSSTGSLHYNVVHNGSFRVTRSAKITAGFKYLLRSSEDYTLGKHLGFDLSSVVPTAYELMPYSWLIDYFTTAGQVIEDTFTADFGQSFYICLNQKLTIEGQTTFRPQSLISQTRLDRFTTNPCTYKYFSFSRSPLSNLPRAPLRFKQPAEVARNATNKLLNLVSILRSRN